MLDNCKILVTGATGFVGKHLILELVKKYSEVCALVRKSSNVEFLKSLGVELRYADLSEKESLKGCVRGTDILIHLAALMSDKDYLPRSEFYRVNVLGTKNILEEALKPVKQFIYISTVGVYGATSINGADETQGYGKRLSKYEFSKAEAEKLVLGFAKQNNIYATILRLGQLYGPQMNYGWPEVIRKIEDGRMFILGKGDTLLQLTYIDDVVQGIMRSINNERCFDQIINICADKAYKMQDILFEIARQLKKPYPQHLPLWPVYLLATVLKTIPLRLKPDGLRYLDVHRVSFFKYHHIYNIKKARELLAYAPQIELNSGIAKMIEWYNERRSRFL